MGGTGPQLAGLAKIDTPSYFAWQIKDPAPPMPRLTLTDKQITDLAAYLEVVGTQRAPVGAALQPGHMK